jgi:hypothetical protein
MEGIWKEFLSLFGIDDDRRKLLETLIKFTNPVWSIGLHKFLCDSIVTNP